MTLEQSPESKDLSLWIGNVRAALRLGSQEVTCQSFSLLEFLEELQQLRSQSGIAEVGLTEKKEYVPFKGFDSTKHGLLAPPKVKYKKAP